MYSYFIRPHSRDICHLQDSGFLDGAFQSQNAALGPLSRLLYDELVKSILRIVEKLDLSVQKVTTGEEVRCRGGEPRSANTSDWLMSTMCVISLSSFCRKLILLNGMSEL